MSRVVALSLVSLVVLVGCENDPARPSLLTTPLMQLQPASGATVVTDQDDYYPGDTVHVTGSGWEAGETVQLVFEEDPVIHAPDTLFVVADEDGNIASSEYVIDDHDLGQSFTLTATGLSSGLTAVAVFTDAPRVGSVVVGAQSPSSVAPGSSATFEVTVNRGSGQGSTGAFSATLSIAGLPAGGGASFSPSTVSFTPSQNSRTSTLTVTTSGTTPPASTAFSVTATSTTSSTDNASGSGTLTVARLNQTITFGGLADRAFGDPPFTVSATASSGLPVSFDALGDCFISSGTLVNLTGAGSCTVIASQGGNATYNPAPSVSRSFTIHKANQTIAFGGAPGTAVFGTSFVVSASASSGLPVAVAASGACSISGLTVTMTSGTGVCSLTADQAGDANYNAAPQATQSTTAERASQAIDFGPLADKTFGDPAFIVIATASSDLLVAFASLTPGTCSVADELVTILHAGPCTIRASQGGNANYLPAAPVDQSFEIDRATQTITFGALANRTYGDPPFGISASAGSGLAVGFAAAGNCSLSGDQVHITGAGSCTITASQGGDGDWYPAPNVVRSFDIARAVLTVTADNQSKQYSDPLPSLDGWMSGFVNGETATALGGALACTTTATQFSGPGSYPITCAGLASDNYSFTYVQGWLTVTREDARGTYTGALFASTSGVNSSSAWVTLSASIQDITAIDAVADPDGGDIRNATVRFVNRDNGAWLCSANVGLVNSGDPLTGTATCNWQANIGSANSQSYTVGVVVEGYYARNSGDDNAVVTVSKPLNEFITGGGHLVLASSAGQKAGDAGTKNNFGFNVKYNKSGTNLQGNINVIVRRTEGGALRVYQVKGNAMTSLSSDPLTGQATFNGKASIQDITDPTNPIPVDGNATLQVVMTDNGEPGPTDEIAITVWNKQGGMWFASQWSGVQTTKQQLGGGNVVVR